MKQDLPLNQENILCRFEYIPNITSFLLGSKTLLILPFKIDLFNSETTPLVTIPSNDIKFQLYFQKYNNYII